MASKSRSIDLNALMEDALAQFRGLNPNEPGQWPPLPKAAAFAAVALVVVALGWVFMLSASNDEVENERAKEPGLRQSFTDKLAQSVNLPELRKQKLQVQEYVTQLEKQLPGKAEMDALLSDINQAGIGRGLQFELFRPGQVAVKDYYAELPIAIRVVGRFHDIGAFAADVANLSRIVTLHNMTIQPPVVAGTATGKDLPTGMLSMDATAHTYRYLDPSEVIEQKKAADKAKAGAKK